MLGRLARWWRDARDLNREIDQARAAAAEPYPPVLYGSLGEMGHPDDRADDWPPAGTGT